MLEEYTCNYINLYSKSKFYPSILSISIAFNVICFAFCFEIFNITVLWCSSLYHQSFKLALSAIWSPNSTHWIIIASILNQLLLLVKFTVIEFFFDFIALCLILALLCTLLICHSCISSYSFASSCFFVIVFQYWKCLGPQSLTTLKSCRSISFS